MGGRPSLSTLPFLEITPTEFENISMFGCSMSNLGAGNPWKSHVLDKQYSYYGPKTLNPRQEGQEFISEAIKVGQALIRICGWCHPARKKRCEPPHVMMRLVVVVVA